MKNVVFGLALAMIVACSANGGAARLEQIDEYEFQESINNLVESARESSGCKLVVLDIGPDPFDDTIISNVGLVNEGSECDEAILNLNDIGRSKGISFISTVVFPIGKIPDSASPPNVDLIHEIDPQQEIF